MVATRVNDPKINNFQSIHDLALLAVTEAAGQGDLGMIAVMHTALNRYDIKTHVDSSYTLQDLIYQKWQYTGLHPLGVVDGQRFSTRPEYETAIQDKIGIRYDQYLHAIELVYGVLDGSHADPVNGSTHYYNPAIVDRPSWATAESFILTLGDHDFYADISFPPSSKIYVDSWNFSNKPGNIDQLWSAVAHNIGDVHGLYLTWDDNSFAGGEVGEAIFGLGGNDIINGGGGNDGLSGGSDNDTLYGGPGNDTYGFAFNDGNDIIFDQGRGGEQDVLEVYGAGVTTSLQYLLYSRVGGNDLRIDVLDGQGMKHGSVTIQDMDNPANQVETLALMASDETKIADVYLPGVFERQSANNPPWLQTTTGSKAVNVGQLADVNTLWKASDSDPGDAIEWWAFWDSDAQANTGHLEITSAPFWVWNGGAWQQDTDGGIAPAGQWIMVTDQAYRVGAVDYVDHTVADAGEWIYGLANDGEMWSNTTAIWLV